jgi:inhibitor of KinA sporulation pathway (predicted exonuclease)
MILVVDLEATCADDGSIPEGAMEIIEIGACWATPEGVVVDRFQAYVRPIQQPILTQFCVNLLGIEQKLIDSAEPFSSVAIALQEFVRRHRTPTSSWGSWGAFDRKQIERECLRHGVVDPIGMDHQNIKRLFAKAQRIGKEVGMLKGCELAGVALEGVHHRALDDAFNIAHLLPWALGQRELPGRPRPK